MEIVLNKPYSSLWDNIQYPVYQLSDESYLCITYSCNHMCYGINIYTKQDFIDQGFKENLIYSYLFENITREDIE